MNPRARRLRRQRRKERRWFQPITVVDFAGARLEVELWRKRHAAVHGIWRTLVRPFSYLLEYA